ncbi:hypothetical protein BGZ81_005878 [Podila clonocystis]|nr:hypothetical protein BGZ81_005878 [Podila clonocystis]
MTTHFVERVLFLPIVFIFVSLALTVGVVDAQSPFQPVSTGDSGSVFVEGKALYIQGGTIIQNTTNQTFSISLQYSWNTTSPIYTKLPDGLSDSHFPNTLLLDGTTWFAISDKTFVTYDTLTGNITRRGPAKIYSNFVGLSAMFDRNLSEVVIPNGFTNGARPSTMYVNPGDLTIRAGTLADVPGLARFALAWSESAQKGFLYGGSSTEGLYANLYQREQTLFGSWIPINTTLDGLAIGGPMARESACLVPAFNGTKLIMFGGSGIRPPTLYNVGLSDIYIYDVAKASWTKGTDAGATRARAAHACAVSGDALIVWGGFTDLTSKQPPKEVIAVYNLTRREWVDKFISPNGEQPTVRPTTTAGSGSDSTSSPTPTPGTSGSGNNIGAIIGGVAAAVVVLATLGLVLWRRGLLKKCGIHFNVHHQQSGHRQSDGGHSNKEPVEKIRDPHIDPYVQPLPQPVARSTTGIRHPQLVMSQHERDFAAQMQLENGARHPQFETPQRGPEFAAEMQLVNDTRHPQFDIPQYENGHYQQYQQNRDGLYDNREPVWNNRDPHGSLNVQPSPQPVPRPSNGIRHPQLDIARRKQELAAEMQMLEYGSGEGPAFEQHRDGRSSNSGGSPYPR